MKTQLSRFVQHRIHVTICQYLGWRLALAYIQLLGWIYFITHGKERQTIQEALDTVFTNDRRPQRQTYGQPSGQPNGQPDGQPNGRAFLRRRVCEGILYHYYEKLFNVYAPVETTRRFFQTHFADGGLDRIRQGLKKGKGVLLVTGHYGGVEFIPGYLSVNGIPASIVVRFKTDRLRDVTMEKITAFGTQIIDADRIPNIMSAIRRHLKANRVVITQCDEIDEWRPSPSDTVPFLGKRTYLDRTINVLIKRGRAATVFGLMHRDTDLHYRFIAFSESEIMDRIPALDNGSLGAAMLKMLAHFIYACPEGWYQWKKYPSIPALDTGETVAAEPMGTPLPDESFALA